MYISTVGLRDVLKLAKQNYEGLHCHNVIYKWHYEFIGALHNHIKPIQEINTAPWNLRAQKAHCEKWRITLQRDIAVQCHFCKKNNNLGPYCALTQFWIPSTAQAENIETGLVVNPNHRWTKRRGYLHVEKQYRSFYAIQNSRLQYRCQPFSVIFR